MIKLDLRARLLFSGAALADLRRADVEDMLRAKETVEATLAALPDAVVVVGPDGLVSSANEVARRLLHLASARPRHLDDLPLPPAAQGALRDALEAGQLRLTWDRLDVAALVGQAARAVRASCDEAGIELRLVHREDAPASIWGDAARLQVVLANLLTNALKYTPRGGAVTVLVASGQNAGSAATPSLRIAVTDTGRGVPAEYREQIFEKFFRVEHHHGAGDEGVKGSGIGLYLAREIVEAHGGRIGCDAGERGSGTTIALDLPADRTNRAHATGRWRAPAQDGARSDRDGHLPAHRLDAPPTLAWRARGSGQAVARPLPTAPRNLPMTNHILVPGAEAVDARVSPQPKGKDSGTPAAILNAKTARLRDVSREDSAALFASLEAMPTGLTEAQAAARLQEAGANEVARERPPPWYRQLATAFSNPFIVVLIVLAAIELWSAPDDLKGPIIIGVMVTISVTIRFSQEYRSGRAAERLRALVRTTATVLRRAADAPDAAPGNRREVPVRELVPGDVITLSAGDMIPADVRILSCKDLFVNQAVLTGESMPAEKHSIAELGSREGVSSQDLPNIGLMGTNVVTGAATALVVTTGPGTYFGSIATGILGHRPLTSFDLGVSKITWLMIRFMGVMAPVVFLLNGFTKGDWKEAALFALSVAVGLIPEMLPLVVTANLARGALVMAKKKVVVKRLNAIQNLGAMDVLCTDKTGTLTQDRVVLEQHVDVVGQESHDVLRLAYVNSYHQTGLRNLLDRAVLEHADIKLEADALRAEKKVDEVPFDFVRRRMSVVIETAEGKHLLVCKGAIDEIMSVCDRVEIGGEIGPVTEIIQKHVARITREMNEDGLRVVAVAYREEDAKKTVYSVADERALILAGYIGFLDPPRDSAQPALEALAQHGVTVKVLTGDNDIVAKKVCRDVGLKVLGALRGSEIEALDAAALAEAAERTTIFAQLNPLQKSRVVAALKARGHTVGFLGDGINDAPALREADIGISVDTAVDIAKESADIILLEKSLMVLEQGVLEGRTTFGNMIKYIKMTASSNFGNVFSVLVASAFLPFLPMLAIQLLIQNLLYDISQLSIPWDRMDEEYVRTPRRWDAGNLRRFMLFIGPISSIFDVATFLLMWFVFRANTPAKQALFQSAWFIEGLLSQTLIVHMIRTQKIPFLQSRAAPPVLWLTSAIMALGVALPFTSLGAAVGLVPLPAAFFPWLAAILLAYVVLTHLVKRWYIRRFVHWL